MKERPILFSAPMVRALLNGSKTQTRRVVKPVRHPDFGNIYTPGALAHEPKHVIERSCPYGQLGDRLWVREAFRLVRTVPGGADGDKIPPSMFLDSTRKFEADGSTSLPDGWMRVFGKLRPGIHMPRWASRITLEVTGVRVERLQDISEADAIAEGARECDPVSGREVLLAGPSQRGSFVLHYRDIWQQINGPESWGANPLVWVVEFKLVEGTKS
jgi:hypothetical protein